jgi:hypothetical protein
MGIWVGVVVLAFVLAVGVVWARRAGRAERLEWRQLRRAGRRELRQLRRNNGTNVNASEIAARRHGDPGSFSPF